jgi:post-segregation antitoxin (ccd killing protein)
MPTDRKHRSGGKVIYVQKSERASDGASARTETTNSSDAIKKALLGLPEDEQKDFYFHSSSVSEDTYGKYADEALEEQAKYGSFTVNENLPKLTGSEKQVSWAEDIRYKLLAQEVDRIDHRAPSTVEGKKQLVDQAKSHGMEVDSYSDALNLALQRSKTFKWLKETTSAKELIDNRYGKVK